MKALTSALILISVVFLPLTSHQDHPIQHNNKKACAGCTCEQMKLIGAVASYSWYPSGEMCEAGPRYPMAWDVWSPLEKQAIAATGGLMGFNEPDNCDPGGSCLSMAQVVARWPALETACWDMCRLVGPAPSQNNPNWYLDFYSAYEAMHGNKPRVDVMATHCYFTPDSVDTCIAHIEHQVAIAKMLGISSVWVTEWAALPGTDYSVREAQVTGNQFMKYLEDEPMVELYFWYAGVDECQAHGHGFESARLFYQPCNRLTAMGEWYAGGQNE